MKVLGLIAALLGCASCGAHRTLKQDQGGILKCGYFAEDTDLPAEPHLGEPVHTDTNEACLELCIGTPSCNAMIRIADGRCFLKTVPVDTPPLLVAGMTSLIICPEDAGNATESAVAPATVATEAPEIDSATAPAGESGTLPCGEIIADTDLLAGEANLPGSETHTATNEDCIALCVAPTCNAAIRIADGRCFLKNVPRTTALIPSPGVTTYVLCPDGGADPEPLANRTKAEPAVAVPDAANATQADPLPAAPIADTVLVPAPVAANTTAAAPAPVESGLPPVAPADPVAANATAAVVPPAPAPVPAATLVIPTPPAGGAEAFFAMEGCPASTPKLSAGKAQAQLTVKPAARAAYQGPNALSQMTDNQIQLGFGNIGNGEQYCFTEGNQKVLVGGTLALKSGGQCIPGSCCTIKMWQPSSDGYYYDNCSMTMTPDADGVWYFRTEVPGDESKVGWGPDPDPHFHFDIQCNGCAGAGDAAFWNKFYINSFCTSCGATAAGHLAEKVTFSGEESYKYNIVIDA